jgi:hypothetical protein
VRKCPSGLLIAQVEERSNHPFPHIFAYPLSLSLPLSTLSLSLYLSIYLIHTHTHTERERERETHAMSSPARHPRKHGHLFPPLGTNSIATYGQVHVQGDEGGGSSDARANGVQYDASADCLYRLGVSGLLDYRHAPWHQRHPSHLGAGGHDGRYVPAANDTPFMPSIIQLGVFVSLHLR